jgi:hypothetical protein
MHAGLTGSLPVLAHCMAVLVLGCSTRSKAYLVENATGSD